MAATVELAHIAKSFGPVQAVADVSFAVDRGEILGLLGPNGAGKTTSIRMMLDIFKPDRGLISVLDGPLTEAKKDRIGYMPEDRGLYQDIPLERCLVYLAMLKGLSPIEARERVCAYLERLDLAEHRSKKVKDLSKGMQQKAQVIAAVVHRPELLVVDEPFAGLDPINTQAIKDLLREMRAAGTAILMSTHQMHQVEELCDRIVLIDHGRDVLYGRLAEVQRRYAGNAVLVGSPNPLPALPGVQAVAPHNSAAKLTLAPGTTPQAVLRELVDQGVVVERFELAMPSLEEIFIQVVARGGV